MKQHNKWITYTVPMKWQGHTVSDVLKDALLLSNRMINRLTRSRGIRLNGKMPWLKRRLEEGDRLQIAVRPREKADLDPEPVAFSIVYEDDDIMGVDKPAGITIYPTRPEERGTLAHGIVYYWREQGWEGRVRPVHRLDRHTSGLLLIAKSAYAHQLMDREFRQGSIQRDYLAIIEGKLGEKGQTGTIDAPISRDPHHPLRRRVDHKGDHAITHYRVLAQAERATLVYVQLETGRTHQIRVHFSHRGYPLLGDSLYGGSTYSIRRQALHACRLSFPHPLFEKEVEIHSPLSEDLIFLAKKMKLEVPAKYTP